MEAVHKAKQRLKLFPKYLASCAAEGSVYAKCVTLTDDPKQNHCEKEFLAFKKCLTAAAKKSGSRI
jgi:predicted nucleic acid-binding Zn ribbon protein